MAVDLKIRIDTRAFEAAMVAFPKQVPYAIAGSINNALFAARAAIKDDLPNYFTIRTQFLPRGLHVFKANKQTQSGWVGFLESRWFAASQVTGEKGRKKPGDKPIWQPNEAKDSEHDRPPRPIKSQKIIPSRRPNVASAKDTGKKRKGRIINAVRYIKIVDGRGGLFPGIYYRPKGENKQLVAAYWLEPHMDIKPRYPMLERTQEVVGRVWPDAALQAIAHAIKTAR